MQRGGQQIPISLGRQLPLTARGPTVKAVLYHAAKMEEARVHRPGAEDSTMLMGLIGGHGYGKTTALIELLPKLRELIINDPETALSVVREACPSRSPAAHARLLQRMLNGAGESDRKRLVSWIRLGAAPELHPLESSLSMDSIAALRVMYGLHTYLDDMSGLTGPQGLSTYSEFLEGFERIVMRRLSLDDVFMYLERVAGPITDPRAIFILIDDLDSALPRAAEGEASWAQHMLPALVKYLEQMAGHDRLVLTIFSRFKAADGIFTNTATPNILTAPLPLGSPGMEDLQGMLCQVLQLLSGEGVNQGLHNPAAIMEWDSPITQLVCKTGGNFLLLDWLLSALGGAPIHGAAADWWMDWGPGKLARWLTWSSRRELTTEEQTELSSILAGMDSKMLEAGWLRRILGQEQLLGEGNMPARKAVAQKVAVHGLVGTTVRLMDEVPGSPGITWGMLYEEGLFNPLFAGDQQDGPNSMPPAHSEVSVATAVGDLRLCPPTRDPTTLWCTVQMCPLALDRLATDVQD